MDPAAASRVSPPAAAAASGRVSPSPVAAAAVAIVARVSPSDAAVSSARVSPTSAVVADTPSPPTLPAPPPSGAAKEAVLALAAVGAQRQRFTVELNVDETNIVSWKKLLKGSKVPEREAELEPVGAALAVAGPSTAVQPAEDEPKDEVPPPSRFSAVIEKIERLYTGKESSDEEGLGDNPDDDQYDTEDSFIDDAELDEYFQVDKLETRHNGYFINRGKLEQIEPCSSPIQAPKKRRRKDPAKSCSEKGHELVPVEPVNMGNMRIKAAARSAPLTGKKLSSPKTLTTYDNHYQDEKLKINSSGPTGTYKKSSSDFNINSESVSSVKISSKDPLSVSLESKEKDKIGAISSKDLTLKSRATSESSDVLHKASRDKGSASQIDSQAKLKPKKLLNSEHNMEISTKKRQRDSNGVGELPYTTSSEKAYSMLAAQPSLMKEDSIVRPKGSTLERAIRDLQKIVGESRPLNLNAQELDPSSQTIKRRLPQDIKQKLAKVARLSANQGKVSENELLDRLMGILGHIVQRKTLKRHIKEMVLLGLSAKQQKDDTVQQVSKELREMIGTHVSLIRSKVPEQHEGSADDFQEMTGNDEKRVLKGKYSMDKALEDKMCDLYDLYVEGMDEDKGPQSRKLYVQLAELWPSGYMDNHGIKDAIFRSKERKRAKYRRHKSLDEERIKRKRLASSNMVEANALAGQVRAGHERLATDSSGQVSASYPKLTSNQHSATSGRSVDRTHLNDYGHYESTKPYDKVRGSNANCSGTTALEDGTKYVVADVKKKLKKRKVDPSIDDYYGLPHKLSTHQVKDKSHIHRQADDSNVSPYPLQSLQQAVVPDSIPPS